MPCRSMRASISCGRAKLCALAACRSARAAAPAALGGGAIFTGDGRARRSRGRQPAPPAARRAWRPAPARAVLAQRLDLLCNAIPQLRALPRSGRACGACAAGQIRNSGGRRFIASLAGGGRLTVTQRLGTLPSAAPPAAAPTPAPTWPTRGRPRRTRPWRPSADPWARLAETALRFSPTAARPAPAACGRAPTGSRLFGTSIDEARMVLAAGPSHPAGVRARAEIEIGARGPDDGRAGVLRDHQPVERRLGALRIRSAARPR